MNGIWNESYMNCGYWNQVKLWSSQLWTQFLQLRREVWKIQDFNRVWTRDLAFKPRWSPEFFRLLYAFVKIAFITAKIIALLDFISAVHIWFISYTIHHWFIPHGTIRAHKWPAPNASGFIAQLVRASHRNREVTGSNPVEVLNFSGFSTQL